MRNSELFPFNAHSFGTRFFLLLILTALMALLLPSLESFTLVLDETSSTISVARIAIFQYKVLKFLPCVSQLRFTWHSIV